MMLVVLGPRTIGIKFLVKNKCLEKIKYPKCSNSFFLKIVFLISKMCYLTRNFIFYNKIKNFDPNSWIFFQFHNSLNNFHHTSWSFQIDGPDILKNYKKCEFDFSLFTLIFGVYIPWECYHVIGNQIWKTSHQASSKSEFVRLFQADFLIFIIFVGPTTCRAIYSETTVGAKQRDL